MIRILKISMLVTVFAVSTSVVKTYAHHNSNLPEGVDPLWRGIELYSNHNDAIEHSLEMRSSSNTMNSDYGVAPGQGTQVSSQAMSGSTSRAGYRK